MLRYSRLTFISGLLLLALIVPTNVVQAQASPQAPANKLVAPSTTLAVPDEVTQAVKLRASLTAEQISKMQAILDSYKADLQQITTEFTNLEASPSAQDKKLFLPLVNESGNAQSQAKAPDLTSTPEKAEALRQITSRLLALQDKINQEVEAQLAADQSKVYAKQATKLKSMGQAIASKSTAMSQSPTEAGSLSDCYYGAYYSAIANYYSWLEYYYGYYDYIYYGNTYAYYDYLYAYYAYYYANYAQLYAGGAYWDAYAGFGYDYNNWSGTASSDLSSAYDWEYYAYWYGWYSYYYYGSPYGYYSYYYSYYYARYYEQLALSYEVNC
jgi:hypothetical protein